MDMVAKLDSIYPQLRRRWTRCHFCGATSEHIHHIKGRSNLLIRYDLKNLIPLCADCHRLIHDKGIKVQNYITPSRWLYLTQMENIQIQDWLLTHNQTREEFLRQKEKELKEIINGRY